MRTEAEHIAEGIREYVAKLNELLELAQAEKLTVIIQGAWKGKFDDSDFSLCHLSTSDRLRVDSISRKEIL